MKFRKVRFVGHVRLFEKIRSSYKCFVWKSEVGLLSQIKVIILEFILELSKVGCQLYSSGSV
jgi:hypothetical protein